MSSGGNGDGGGNGDVCRDHGRWSILGGGGLEMGALIIKWGVCGM